MSLSDSETELLSGAGGAPDPVQRQQAAAIVLRKEGDDRAEARALLAASYLRHTQPSFHLIPRGDSMADESAFTDAYGYLATATAGFTRTDAETLATAIQDNPRSLAPLRMILGLTYSELAVAVRLAGSPFAISATALKNLERSQRRGGLTERQRSMATAIAGAVSAVMNRDILQVPDTASSHFHSKLDKRDTIDGWRSVAASSSGVPYSALLYQRYAGGVWRQVQDAYSEVKGDALLEYPLRDLLTHHHVPHHHTRSGATGAEETMARYGVSPGPDFVVPDESPTLVIEAKVGEDGGTVRDKAARIRTMAEAASARGLTACALIDGKGWSERTAALLDVILATQGRTYTLSTLDHLLELPEIKAAAEAD